MGNKKSSLDDKLFNKYKTLDLFDDLLTALSSWKKVSNKDYQTLNRIYYTLLGKKQRLAFPKPKEVKDEK